MKQIILILILAISSCFSQPNLYCNSHYLPDPVHFSGSATAKLKPEVAQISVSVEVLDGEATIALERNAQIIADIVEEIKSEHGVLDEEISTTNLNIFPQYRSFFNKTSEQWTQVFEGTKVVNTLLVETKMKDNAGKIVDSSINNGATRINFVAFDATAESKKDSQDSLIKLAIKDARNRAELALEELNHKIIGIKSVSVNPNFINQYRNKQMDFNGGFQEDAAPSAPTQVFQSDVSVSVNVSVSFLIQNTGA